MFVLKEKTHNYHFWQLIEKNYDHILTLKSLSVAVVCRMEALTAVFLCTEVRYG